jgi:DNA-binding MarR family transcriptional regulator/DNA-binding response OmpR family regulator
MSTDLSNNLFAGDSNDELVFADEPEDLIFAEELAETDTQSPPEQTWKILIVDDDPEVHNVTKLALSDFSFEGRSLSFISAYSAQEAKRLIQQHPDTAILFLDVVMETESAGLDVINYVREELKNYIVRIVLRTGQPGCAPEDQVAVNYGIDDYKTKTELTSQKLSITVITALRAFSTLTGLAETSRNLELEVNQHKQAEAVLRLLEAREREKVQQLEHSMRLLQQFQFQPPEDRLGMLGQVVTATHELINPLNETGGLQTLSIITRIARTVLRITDEQSAKLGVSPTKLAVLMYLGSEAEFCTSPSELAKHCGVSRAAMTKVLDGLEQEGYIERDIHPTDRRALMVKLTPEGQQFLDWIAPQDQYQLSELMNNLDDTERTKLMELAMRMMQLFEDQTDSG